MTFLRELTTKKQTQKQNKLYEKEKLYAASSIASPWLALQC